MVWSPDRVYGKITRSYCHASCPEILWEHFTLLMQELMSAYQLPAYIHPVLPYQGCKIRWVRITSFENTETIILADTHT